MQVHGGNYLQNSACHSPMSFKESVPTASCSEVAHSPSCTPALDHELLPLWTFTHDHSPQVCLSHLPYKNLGRAFQICQASTCWSTRREFGSIVFPGFKTIFRGIGIPAVSCFSTLSCRCGSHKPTTACRERYAESNRF